MTWDRAPLPPRNHRCQPASTSELIDGIMQRCACGAARFLTTSSPRTPRWVGRNTRQGSMLKPYRQPAWARLIKRLL